MRNMKQWSVFISAVILCLCLLSGCGGGEPVPMLPPTDAESPATTAATTQTQTSAGIVGTWKYRGSLDCEYTFCADGTGIYNYTGTQMPFTYTDDGTAVSILYEGNTAPTVLKYTISEETLNIEDSFGQVMQYDLVTQ